MKYPRLIEGYEDRINRLAKYKAEMGAKLIDEKLDEIKLILCEKLMELESLEESVLRSSEPSDYESIVKSSPQNKTRLNQSLSDEVYYKKLKGAIIGRFAGCALGAPVELLHIDELEKFADMINMSFPPRNYWTKAPSGYWPRYKVGKGNEFTLEEMKFLPPDDDIAYTFMSMLVLEEFGENFTTEDISKFWIKYLPVECTYTAERITINNLKNGVRPLRAAEVSNSDSELIGASIRCDGWAYVNPLNPIKASEFAHRDAYLSHRKSGIYSEMYFAAVISLAFNSDTILEALKIGLEYIPSDCEFSRQVRWALEVAHDVKNYRDANNLVNERFTDMDPVHSINNACLTIWGALLGEMDFTKGISETVAMAYDNDCTAATVGSILGAFMGVDKIPEYWYKPWNNLAISYLNGIESFNIDDVINRFYKLKKSFE